jgi:hypothetical protein
VALSPAARAAAEPRVAALPSPSIALPPVPPIRSNNAGAPVLEVRFPRRIDSRERIRAEIDETGKPFAISVLQSLVVSGTGDYIFAVTGPITNVQRGTDSQSDPGLRRDQILWQGFSARRRLLAANAELRAAEAAPQLPIRVRVESAKDGRIRVRLTNATAVRAQTFSARIARSELIRALAAIRAAAERGLPAPEIVVNAQGPLRPRSITVTAPLRVSGRIEVPGGRPVSFSRILRSPEPLELTTAGSGGENASPRVTIDVTPIPPLDELRLTGGDLLERVTRANLEYGRFRQYATFLANPDPQGKTSASYAFVTGKAPAEAAAPAGDENGDDSTSVVFMVAVLGAAAALGLVVLWAHL